MKILLNILLFIAVLGLTYLAITSISEPIQFGEEWKSRERKIANKLEKIRTAQIAYKDITGSYATSFDSLAQVLKSSKFKIKATIGDPDDPNSNYREFITELSALDSMNTLGINLDSLAYVPFGNGATFTIESKILAEYQSAKNIPVLKVSTPVEAFMGPWADIRFKRYDKKYDPKSKIYFGDLTKPSTDGNWRK